METEAQPEPIAVAKPKRRWWQYSLTSFLVIVTALGVALGLIGRRAERRRRAVAAIEAQGGRYNRAPMKGTAGLLRWLPRSWGDDVVRVSFEEDKRHLYTEEWPDTEIEGFDSDGIHVTNTGLVYLQDLPGLVELSLRRTRITDAGLIHLEGLTGLEVLYLGETPLTDAGVVHLRRLARLRMLDLTGTTLTDVGLLQLQGMTNLESLWIYKTEVSDAGVAELQEVLPRCTIYH